MTSAKTRDVRRAARDDAVKRIAASGKRDCASYVSKLLKKTGDAVLDAQAFSAILERASRSDADKIVLRGATLACTLLAQRHPSLLALLQRRSSPLPRASADARNATGLHGCGASVPGHRSQGQRSRRISAKGRDGARQLKRGDDDDDEDGFLAACAKEGVAALASLHDETGGSTILEALDDKSDDCWVYGASRLLARLRALTRVVELFPEDIATSDVVTRVKTSLIEQRPPPDLAFDENEGRSSLSGSDFGRPKNDQAFAEAFLALRAALKVVTAARDLSKRKNAAARSKQGTDAFDLCFKVIDSDGEPPSGAQCTSEERASYD